MPLQLESDAVKKLTEMLHDHIGDVGNAGRRLSGTHLQVRLEREECLKFVGLEVSES